MIKDFKCKETEKLFKRRGFIKKLSSNMQRLALRKLMILDAASKLETLKVPPGNCLESLKGNRKDQYSIRINDQWRICFKWVSGDAFAVEIVDYH